MQTTARKGFLLPQVTDDDPTPNAVVRDTFNYNANLSDKGTFFDANENITGRWTFAAIALTSGITSDFTNNTGAARVNGDVVMVDTAIDRSIIMPTAAAPGYKVGVCTEAIASGAVGRVAFEGFTRVKCTGATRLQYLQTQANDVVAIGNTAPTIAMFAVILENPVGGTALAYLHPSAGVDVESFFLGSTLRNGNATVTSAELIGKLYFFGNRATAQTVTLPDPTLTSRPITIAAEGAGSITVAVDGGSSVVGGSTNLTTGAITNGTIVAGDAFQYKSNGTQWRAV